MRCRRLSAAFALLSLVPASGLTGAPAAIRVGGEITEAQTGQPLAARIYIRGADGTWHFPQSAAAGGSAIRYERERRNSDSFEKHTTLSAHPFRLELPPGRYTFTIERGKEYLPETREVTVAGEPPALSFRLRRWANLAAAGWFSGDTHVHREPAELANVMLAEDLNVALPMLDWTSDSEVMPTASPKTLGHLTGNDPVAIDATHVWHPRNTEYEIFRTGNVSHMLGAILILNHRTRFEQTVFPLADVVAKVRREGGLIDLEKHNWPWSLALVPVAKIDLFELANNHLWRVDYAVKNWALPAPPWMRLSGSGTDTERDWAQYGFETYYALLNCGFRLRPTAGSANGVHAVPLGFSRVYVQIDGAFSYEKWIRGLDEGRSFVTTGPMLQARANDRWPGASFGLDGATALRLRADARSEHPLEAIELIENGELVRRFAPTNRREADGYSNALTFEHRPQRSGWIVWRCFERRPDGRLRYAHTAPWHFTVPGRPLLPRREQIEWLVASVKTEIARTRPVAPRSLIEEYERALKSYEEIAARVR